MIRRVLKTLTTGAEAESDRRLQRLLRQAGISGWVGNHPVFDGRRLVGRVDVGFADLKVAIEVDGLAYHSDRQRFQRDRTRQNDLVALGWTVLRFTWADLVERPDYVLATIGRHTMSGVSYRP
jgi:very-short-patch-repair endonuclease